MQLDRVRLSSFDADRDTARVWFLDDLFECLAGFTEDELEGARDVALALPTSLLHDVLIKRWRFEARWYLYGRLEHTTTWQWGEGQSEASSSESEEPGDSMESSDEVEVVDLTGLDD